MGTDRQGLRGQGRVRSAGADRRRELVSAGPDRIDVIVEGEGPAIVLLPSSLRDSNDFDALAGLLAAQAFQVLRPQPRGMGRSSDPPPGMSLETLAADVACVIERLADGPAVVVGHAYGHWVARMTDIRHPERVRAVVALGAAARQFPPGMAQALAAASDPALGEDERLAALRLCMFAPGNDPRPWLQGWHPHLRTAYRQAAEHPPKDDWYSIANAPLLDLQAEHDAWRPPATRGELAQLLGRKVTVAVIPGAGHALVPEQPEAVARAIVGWIRSLPDAG